MADDETITIVKSKKQILKETVPQKLDDLVIISFRQEEKLNEIFKEIRGDGKNGLVKQSDKHSQQIEVIEGQVKDTKIMFWTILFCILGLAIRVLLK